jgi:hypothetical protein
VMTGATGLHDFLSLMPTRKEPCPLEASSKDGDNGQQIAAEFFRGRFRLGFLGACHRHAITSQLPQEIAITAVGQLLQIREENLGDGALRGQGLPVGERFTLLVDPRSLLLKNAGARIPLLWRLAWKPLPWAVPIPVRFWLGRGPPRLHCHPIGEGLSHTAGNVPQTIEPPLRRRTPVIHFSGFLAAPVRGRRHSHEPCGLPHRHNLCLIHRDLILLTMMLDNYLLTSRCLP